MPSLPGADHRRALGRGEFDAADDCAVVRVRRERLPPGDAGIYRTLDVMAALVREGTQHPVVRAAAEEAVTGVHPRDLVGQMAAVRDWIAERVEYRRDPILAEWLQTPWYVIHCQIRRGLRPQLDCDDLTDLAQSMLGSIGFPIAFRVVSTRPDRRYNHVFGLVQADGRDWAVDLTRMWARPGSVPAPETRGRTVPVVWPRTAAPAWRYYEHAGGRSQVRG